MKLITENRKKEEPLSIIISFYVLSLVLINAAEYVGIGGSIGLSGKVSFVSKVILLFLIQWNTKKFLAGYSRRFLLLIIILAVVFVYSIVVSSDKKAVLEESISFWIGVFPLLLVTVKIERFDLV